MELRRILLVEDAEADRRMIKRTLSQHTLEECDTVESAADALRCASFDLRLDRSEST